MVKPEVYVEGGGPPGKTTNILCRRGFVELFGNCGLDTENFDVIACGGRGEARNDFLLAHAAAAGDHYVALLIDSEEPVSCISQTWKHLEDYSNWKRPPGARDNQVLFMTRCMETWVVADRSTLREHFGENLQVSELPELDDLEGVSPGMLAIRLRSATQDCPEPYSKGRNSFAVLGKLNPNILEERLPSFRRVRLILRNKLG